MPRGTRLRAMLAWTLLLLVVCALGYAAPGWSQQNEFLPPERAYRYTTRVEGERLIVTWRIEPGYYLYKSKMGIASDSPQVRLGDPAWPKGEEHSDEYFGTQEIYRGTVQVPVPIQAQDARPSTLALQLKLQGCADAGLCYPPLRWKTDVGLPGAATPRAAAQGGAAAPGGATVSGAAAAPGTAAAPRGAGAASAFFSRSGRDDEFLPPDEAFRFGASVLGPDAIGLTWVIADGYYLYKPSIQVTSTTTGAQIGEPALPAGEPKHDEFFGDTEVYYAVLESTLPVARTAGGVTDLGLQITYQGCAEAGLCYNPITKTVALELPSAPADAAASPPTSADRGAPLAEQDRLAALIRDGHLAAVLATFFGLGVLLSLTPCVLPMIPILSGIIVGQGGIVTPLRGFSLAMTYVQGMALTYAAAGAAFVLAFKQAPQAFFQQPWIIVLFALLFIALALAMFGAYNLQLPSALQTRLSDVSGRQRSGTYVGTFIMGALSALIVTACVAPAIIAALSVISQTGQVARGAGALYATGLGMGMPLLVVGASAGSLLPRAGAWMDAVKSLFGVLFLGVAIYLLTPLLPGALTMLLWSVLAVVAGFWIFSLRGQAGAPVAAPIRGAGLIAVAYGLLLLVGAASGSRDPLQPLDTLRAGPAAGADGQRLAASAQHALSFQRIKTVDDLEQALARAGASGRPVMLDFYADWCVSCKEMEKYTFTNPSVQAALADAVLLQADVTVNDEADQALMRRFGIFGPPTIAFFGPDGVERRNYRLVGFSPAERFREHVSAAFSS